MVITEPGPLPDNVTLVAPPGDWHQWNGEAWAEDPDRLRTVMSGRAELQRRQRLEEAYRITADWRTELMLDIITDDNRASLTAWML
ncbi:tail fiber assembly protein, partial [Enterobacter mori]|uniref:tail fiber assembly protein n=1 Tax=Enterobacter mori TaxID=539813 RepID=UPI00398B2B3C